MPSGYAHYRFGAQLLPTLPKEIRQVISRHRCLYDIGLHGPDIFMYYNPLGKTKVGALAEELHAQTGRVFFERICKRLRLTPTEPALAYLYGLLAHYSLDALCHPFVYRCAREGSVEHLELETEFDRYLLEKDGKVPPHIQDCSRHIRLSREECTVVAGFYPEVASREIGRSVRNMAWSLRQLANPNPLFRKAMTGVLGLTSKYSQLLMPEAPVPRCARWDGELEELYRQALALYPRLLARITANLTRGEELGPDFAPAFDIY